MIVCVCNALRERACRETACRPECRNAGCIYRMLGAQVRCGRCVPQMRLIFAEAKSAAPVDASAGTGSCQAV